MTKTIVYIDALNLYHRALKDTPYRWLDIGALCRALLPKEYSIEQIKYFTSEISGKFDPGAPRRQAALFRALKTIPNFKPIRGFFSDQQHELRCVDDPTQKVLVHQSTEKCSDVNLASHLIHDGHLSRYDVATVISNDSDLREAFRIVRVELKRKIRLLCPAANPNPHLASYATVTLITPDVLKACQFPDCIVSTDGKTITKPRAW